MGPQRLVQPIAALIILSVLVAVPASAFAGQTPATKKACATTKTKSKAHKLASAAGQVFVFGVYGGNIRPWKVTINSDGSVASENMDVRDKNLAVPADTLTALLKLADAEGYWSMPGLTQCTGTLPDIGTRYLQVSSNTGTKKVAFHGGCNSSFNQLYAAMMAAADIAH